MNRPTITAVAVAALVWGCSGFATADEAPVCPPDLGIPEPIGVCGRDGNGPVVLEEPAVEEPAVSASTPARPVVAAPRFTG